MHLLDCQSRGGAITEYCSALAGSSALAARRGSINAEEIPPWDRFLGNDCEEVLESIERVVLSSLQVHLLYIYLSWRE
jgi:hypothetical protein